MDWVSFVILCFCTRILVCGLLYNWYIIANLNSYIIMKIYHLMNLETSFFRQVRQSNPVLNGPTVPKVLPIVSEQDLHFEHLRQAFSQQNSLENVPKNQLSNNNMPVVTNSAQYNTPIALYSKDTLNQELSRYQNNHSCV